ncbi:MAG: membrane-associated protein [Gammaproteobacteria bacterium]|nr:membrane-associated protein [Gammaproteobacteria bacterium]
MTMRVDTTISLWIKLAYTLFVFVLVPAYWLEYGPENFLWGSDIALLVTLLALWAESARLASMMAVAILLPELAWNIDFFWRLTFGVDVLSLPGTQYMFDPELPLLVRGLSLFHIALPALLVWLVYRLGYERRALIDQTVLAWAVLAATYLFTDPAANINWVRGFGREPQTWMAAPVYLVLLMIAIPLVVYLPTHLLLKWLFAAPRSR